MNYKRLNTTVMTYLEAHVANFEPSDKEITFIKKKLRFNDKNQIEVAGFLIVPIVSLIYAILVNTNAILYVNDLSDHYAMAFSGALILMHGGLLYMTYKKKKLTILLYKINYFLVIVASSFSVTTIIFAFFWLFYFTLSKRVKYTFVE